MSVAKYICRPKHLEEIGENKVMILSRKKPNVRVDMFLPINAISMFENVFERTRVIWFVVDDVSADNVWIDRMFMKRTDENAVVAVDADIYKSKRIPCDIILTEEMEYVS